MARINCKHHPLRGARWACGACLCNFCSSCISRDTVGARGVCPLCRQPLTDIGTERLIPAFWTVLPRFFSYPFQPRVLGVLVSLIALSRLVGYQSVLGILLQIVLFFLLTRFAYAVMAHGAEGHRGPPPVASLTRDLGLVLKQYVVFFALAIPMIPATLFGGEFGAVAGSLLFMGLMPASMMVLATTESLGEAVNPGRLFGTVRSIGWAYLAMFGILTLLSGGAAVFEAWITESLMGDYAELMAQVADDPESVDEEALAAASTAFTDRLFSWGLPLLIFVESYFALAAFALMGYVLYQYHDRLGLPVAVPVDGDAETARNEHPLLGDIEVLIREGRYEEAADRLRERVLANRDDMKLRDRFHRLLVALGDKRRALGHGAEYIGMLLRGPNAAKAAAVYKDCRGLDAAFRPESPGQILPLAQVLFQVGDHEGVVSLSNGFHLASAGHPDIPAVYLLAARSLSDGLGRDQQARTLLQSLVRNYGDHPLTPQIQRYLDALERLTPQAAS